MGGSSIYKLPLSRTRRDCLKLRGIPDIEGKILEK